MKTSIDITSVNFLKYFSVKIFPTMELNLLFMNSSKTKLLNKKNTIDMQIKSFHFII